VDRVPPQSTVVVSEQSVAPPPAQAADAAPVPEVPIDPRVPPLANFVASVRTKKRRLFLHQIDSAGGRNYSYYMEPTELKVARIGNSRGVRIPSGTLERYRIGAKVVMEERSDGILLRPVGPASPKLSWEETARDMAAQHEDWTAWDATLGDGLQQIPWESPQPGRVAGRAPKYRRGSRRKR
jgi:antitoxin component of MazEF toxin-antitoxin module